MIRPAKLRVLQKYHLDSSNILHHRKLQISAIYVNQGEECDIITQRGGYTLEISHGSYHFLNESKPVAAFAYLNRLTGGDKSSISSPLHMGKTASGQCLKPQHPVVAQFPQIFLSFWAVSMPVRLLAGFFPFQPLFWRSRSVSF